MFVPFIQLAVLSTAVTGLSTKIDLDYGTFQGRDDTLSDTKSFLGMPFAKAGRLENPACSDTTDYGPACPQQELTASPLKTGDEAVGEILGLAESLLLPNITHQAEDCLNINVQDPKGIKDTFKIPVLMWIYGGGFELGSSTSVGSEQTALPGVIYQGVNLVQRSIEMGQPVVFVSANYRLSFFGTLASKEIAEAGVANLVWGRSFNGDGVRGESAGAMSTTTHMVLNDGNVDGKFRGVWRFSPPVPKVLDYHHAQPIFDGLMTRIECVDASDKLACAKSAPFESIYTAVQGETNFLSYAATLVLWYPWPDGTYLVDDPAKLTAEGKVANVPFVMGNMVDEGTFFSVITQLNVTTDAAIVGYFQSVYWQETPQSLIEELVDLYSSGPADGAPYGTGLANQLGPRYKKIASMIGDYTSTAGRRTLLNVTSDRQDTWSYQIKQSLPLLGQIPLLNPLQVNNIPALGSFHVSDVVLNAFGTIPPALSKNSLIMSSLIQFANTLEPNMKGIDLPHWPKYNPQNPLQFQFREDGCRLVVDDYRKAQMNFIEANADKLRA